MNAFGEFIFQKLVTNQLFSWGFCVVQQGTFYRHQATNNLITTNNRVLSYLVDPFDTETSQF